MNIVSLGEADVFKALETSTAGLSEEEARSRLARDGPNSLEEIKRAPLLGRFLRQFTHFLALLLWVAAALAFLADALHPGQGMATLGWAILGVILINALFSFVQEYKAERAVHALRRLLPDTAWVVRGGQTRQISPGLLVSGDVLLLEEGERVPADARLIEAVHLRVDNSSLTGESAAKLRRAAREPDEAAKDFFTASNLVFAGTTVLSGHGRAVVYATGLRTEFGKIARLATTVDPGLSPLQHEIVKVTHVVALFAVGLGLLFFLIGVSVGRGFWASFLFAVGIIVANVPEGLLPTVTLALAMGSQRMARRKALIKQLMSVETLGCTTVICTDKTGTLTENRMRVDRLYLDGRVLDVGGSHLLENGRLVPMENQRGVESLVRAVACCNNAKPVRGQAGHLLFTGDPTEVALAELAQRHGTAWRSRPPRMGELPFDADRKCMTTLHWIEGKLVAFVKGAPEVVLPLCSRIEVGGEARPLAGPERDAVLAHSRTLAEQAYRVLAVASRRIESGLPALDSSAVERDLTVLGLVGLMDPPHREVLEAVARCRQAGVRVIMITGDHPLTALAVAKQIGLVPAHPGTDQTSGSVIVGTQLDAMGEEDLRFLLAPRPSGRADPVFARMAPQHKLRVVSVLKAMGEVVAVTGDGVNDAPALQKADIGIAMGRAGTDVAKETADMILLDDNFATIVNAIEEGRAVYANIRKFVTSVLSSNVPEIVPYLGYGLLPIPLPLTVPQILAVDLGTDILPALALGADPPDPDLMVQPPRPRTDRLLNLPLLLRAYGFLGLIEAALAMGAFFWFLEAQGWTWGMPLEWTDPLYQQATTVTLAAIVVAQVANVFACRSERASVFTLGFFTNPLVLWGIAAELGLLALIVYTPAGNLILGTGALPWWIWVPLGVGATGLLLAEEVRKRMVAR